MTNDERVLVVLRRVAQGVSNEDYACHLCYDPWPGFFRGRAPRGCVGWARRPYVAQHDDDCPTVLAQQVLTELGLTWEE
jgi:hypothetical protein